MTTVNDPTRFGSIASGPITFGKCSRYKVAALHTRFNAITWFVWDAETVDHNGQPDVIRQTDTLTEAIQGLETATDYRSE